MTGQGVRTIASATANATGTAIKLNESPLVECFTPSLANCTIPVSTSQKVRLGVPSFFLFSSSL